LLERLGTALLPTQEWYQALITCEGYSVPEDLAPLLAESGATALWGATETFVDPEGCHVIYAGLGLPAGRSLAGWATDLQERVLRQLGHYPLSVAVIPMPARTVELWRTPEQLLSPEARAEQQAREQQRIQEQHDAFERRLLTAFLDAGVHALQ